MMQPPKRDSIEEQPSPPSTDQSGSPSRRRFLGGTGAALGLLAVEAHCGGTATASSNRVGVASGADVEGAVRRAVEMAGGLTEIGPGKTVFIKPNAVYPASTPGVTTSPAVLQAVVKLVKERKPSYIVVGERSARGFSTVESLQTSGLTAAAMAGGADEVYAAMSPIEAPDQWQMLQPPHFEETWMPAGGIFALRRMMEADVLISIPVLKDHRWAAYSMGMKIFIGGIGDSSRDILHYNLGGDSDRLARDIAILNQMFHPAMTIVDGWTAMINGGPQGMASDGVFTTPRLIIAGRDRLAVDAMGASYLKLVLNHTLIPTPDEAHATLTAPGGPWSLPQLVHGAELGLGVSGPEQVNLQFDGVADQTALEEMYRLVPSVADAGARAG